MGVAAGTFKLLFRGTASVASFGLGFVLFARPWPDSPIWTKPMDLVKEKGTEHTGGLSPDALAASGLANSALFKQYTRDEKFQLMPVDKLIPEAHRYNQVSQGLMELGSPVMLINREDGELVLFGKADNEGLVGLDGKIHNGIILTLLDESLCFCGFDKLPSKRGVTANLKVDFHGKLPPASNFVLTAKVASARGRKVVIDGRLQTLSAKGKVGDTVANARCLLVEPRWFKWFGWVDLF